MRLRRRGLTHGSVSWRSIGRFGPRRRRIQGIDISTLKRTAQPPRLRIVSATRAIAAVEATTLRLSRHDPISAAEP